LSFFFDGLSSDFEAVSFDLVFSGVDFSDLSELLSESDPLPDLLADLLPDLDDAEELEPEPLKHSKFDI
jgi:hypothetical protein